MEDVVFEQPGEALVRISFFKKNSNLPPFSSQPRRYTETTNHGKDVTLSVVSEGAMTKKRSEVLHAQRLETYQTKTA